jgi:hypothetical protein
MDMMKINDDEYEQWFLEQTGLNRASSDPSEENLAAMLSNAMRAYDKEVKAQCFIDIANMAMFMADKTLGSQGLVSTTVSLIRH